MAAELDDSIAWTIMATFPGFDDPGQLPPQAARLAPKLRAFAGKGIYFGTSSWKYPGWASSGRSLCR